MLAAAHDRYRALDDREAMRAPVLAIMELGSRVLVAINSTNWREVKKSGLLGCAGRCGWFMSASDDSKRAPNQRD